MWQTDSNGNIVYDSNGNPIPVASSSPGITSPGGLAALDQFMSDASAQAASWVSGTAAKTGVTPQTSLASAVSNTQGIVLVAVVALAAVFLLRK